MLPVLVTIGSFKLYTFAVFLFVALFVGLYWWWKLGRDEHLEETALFDTYFLGIFTFVVAARAVYVLLHLSEFENIYRILGVTSFPGMSYLGGAILAIVAICIAAYLREWEIWKVLDNIVTSLGMVLVLGSTGWMLNGSLANVWLYVVQLVWSIVYFVLVTRVRKNFRFYAWYRNERTVALEGLPTLVATLLVGLLYAIRGFWEPTTWRVGPVPYYTIGGVMVVLMSALLIYIRSGRDIFKKKIRRTL